MYVHCFTLREIVPWYTIVYKLDSLILHESFLSICSMFFFPFSKPWSLFFECINDCIRSYHIPVEIYLQYNHKPKKCPPFSKKAKSVAKHCFQISETSNQKYKVESGKGERDREREREKCCQTHFDSIFIGIYFQEVVLIEWHLK